MSTHSARRLPHWLGPWLIVLLVALAYGGVILAQHAGDPLAFAWLGTRYSQGDSAGTEGYDGQFVYYIARDTLGASPYIDVPAYRYQRILLPLLARLLAFGQAEAIPWTLILLNLLALAGGTWITERLLEAHGASRWYALAYGLYGGQLLAVRLDVTEPLSQALLMWGIWWAGRRRWPAAALAFALAALAKETALLTLAGYLLFLLLRRQWRPLFILGAAGIPFVAWQIVLRLWLGAWGAGSGGAGATGFVWLPYGGLLEVSRHGWEVFALFLVILGPVLVAPSLAALWAGVRALLRRQWHPYVFILLFQVLALMTLPFSSWREPLAMLRLSVGFVAAALLFAAWRGSRRALLYSQLWMITLAFLFKE